MLAACNTLLCVTAIDDQEDSVFSTGAPDEEFDERLDEFFGSEAPVPARTQTAVAAAAPGARTRIRKMRRNITASVSGP